jgi:hypothetical protein
MPVRILIAAVLALVCASAERVRNPTKKAGAGPLFQIPRDGKWGFMDRKGHVVIAPAFADERDFFHGLAGVELSNGKWGFINERGKFAIPARFDEVRDFIDDLAPVRVDRKWGYIDTAGRMAIAPRFQAAGEFHEGLARMYVWSKASCDRDAYTSENAPWYAFRFFEDRIFDSGGCAPTDGRMGYIDKTGAVVIPPRFLDAQDFAGGLAAVWVEAVSKLGYIDHTGAMAIAPRFNQAGPFSKGLAAVETGAHVVGNQVVDIAWGFIDKTGALKIPDRFVDAGNFSEGLARVATKMGVSEGYIDHDGKMVIPARFSQAWDFSDGLAVACADDCRFINRSGQVVLRKIDAYLPFSDGLAVIDSGEPRVYVNKKGRRIAPYAIEK